MAASFIRVFSEGQGYRTIPLKEGMSAAEVASQVIKGLSKTCRDVDFSQHRLYHLLEKQDTPGGTNLVPGEVLFDPDDDVFKYNKTASPVGQYWFKVPVGGDAGTGMDGDTMSPRKSSSSKKKDKKDRDSQLPTPVRDKKNDHKLAGVFDVSFGALKGKSHIKETKQIWIHFKDKAPIQYTFDLHNGWDYHIHQIYLKFELSEENPSSFLLQDQSTGRVMHSAADVMSSGNPVLVGPKETRVDQRIIFRLNPEIEIERIVKQMGSYDPAAKRSAFKKLNSCAAQDPANWTIFLRMSGMTFIYQCIMCRGEYPPDTVALALVIVESLLHWDRTQRVEEPQATAILAILRDKETVGSCRMNAAQTLVAMFSSNHASTHCKYLLKSLYKPGQKGGAPGKRQGSSIVVNDSEAGELSTSSELSAIFLENVKVDPLLAWTVFELIYNLCVHAKPLSALSNSEKAQEWPEDMTQEALILGVMGNSAITDVLHSAALQPGRTEVETVLLGFQQNYLKAALREKEEAFEKGNAGHEQLLRLLWTTTVPDQPLEGIVSKQWKQIGFQSDDPSRDFRSMGILGLRHLLYFTETDDTTFRAMCAEMDSRETNYYPIATAGMTISQMIDSVLPKMAQKKIMPLLFDGCQPIEQIYVILFKRLHALWDERNADYMDFNNIRGELEHLFESCLETSTSIQQFNRKVFSFDAQQDKEDTKPVSTIRTTAVYQWGCGVSVPTVERLGVLMSKPVLWVAAGSHCIVVTKTDEVWGWGACSSGQLGPGLPKRIEEPALIASLSGKQLAKVYVADGRTAAVSSAGELWMCGEQLPARDGSEMQSEEPRRITFAGKNEGTSVKKVAFGKSHGVILIRSDRVGRVLTWGRNSFHQLGHSEKDAQVDWPTVVGGLSQANILDIGAGAYHTMAYTADRDLYAWGQNVVKDDGGKKAILGTKEREKSFVEKPSRVKALRMVKLSGGVQEVSCGQTHTVLLSKRGQVFTWGSGKNGRLGHGDEEDHVKPREVVMPEHCVHVLAGNSYTIAVGRSGKLYSWGQGRRGSLGHGTMADALSPKEILLGGRSVACELLGTSGGGMNVAALQFELPSESGSVFGVSLGRLMRQVRGIEENKKYGYSPPYLVQTLCDHILKKGDLRGRVMDFQALASSPEVRLLKHRFESTTKVDMSGVTSETAMKLLLHWIEELPTPVLPKPILDELGEVAVSVEDPAVRCAGIGRILHHKLNQPQSIVFLHIASFFATIVNSSFFDFDITDYMAGMATLCGLMDSSHKAAPPSRSSQSIPVSMMNTSNQSSSPNLSIQNVGSSSSSSPNVMSGSSLPDLGDAVSTFCEVLLRDVAILKFPFYAELLFLCALEPESPVRGKALRELWNALVVIGMPANTQSKLLWQLRNNSASLGMHRGSDVGYDDKNESVSELLHKMEEVEKMKAQSNPQTVIDESVIIVESALPVLRRLMWSVAEEHRCPPLALRELLEELLEILREEQSTLARAKVAHEWRTQLESALHAMKELNGIQSDSDEEQDENEDSKDQRSHGLTTHDVLRNLQSPEILSESFATAASALVANTKRIREQERALDKTFRELRLLWKETDPLEGEVLSSLEKAVGGHLLPYFEDLLLHMTEAYWQEGSVNASQEKVGRILLDADALVSQVLDIHEFTQSRIRVAEASIKNLRDAGIVDESMESIVKEMQAGAERVGQAGAHLQDMLMTCYSGELKAVYSSEEHAFKKIISRLDPILPPDRLKPTLTKSRSRTLDNNRKQSRSLAAIRGGESTSRLLLSATREHGMREKSESFSSSLSP